MSTPEEKAIQQAQINDLIVRANEVASRMQDYDLPLAIVVKRGKDLASGNLATQVELTIDVKVWIKLFELMCDKLDEEGG